MMTFDRAERITNDIMNELAVKTGIEYDPYEPSVIRDGVFDLVMTIDVPPKTPMLVSFHVDDNGDLILHVERIQNN